jgi:hypothetical protein
MGTCSYCGVKETMPFKCKFCGEQFCGEHRLPENHECYGLQRFKEERSKMPEKWIYEPFHSKEKAEVGRKVEKPLNKKIYENIRGIDSRKILYAILAIIIVLTVSQVLI